MELNDIKVYRITHIKNIPHILKYGITHRDSLNKNPKFKNIGDVSLIDTRSNKTVYVDNGEYDPDTKSTSIKLGDFIPFYFGIRMPMLYVTQIGGNFVESPTPAEDIIYLVCHIYKIISNCRGFYFTDGHTTDMLTTFYDKDKINELVEIIDWDAIKALYWGGDENLNLKRKKQAEFLVSGDIHPDHILDFGCYNERARNILIEMGIAESKIKIIPGAYY